MKKYPVTSLCAAIAVAAVAQAPAPKPAPDLTVLHLQVLLDRLGFTPGVIDGWAASRWRWR